MPRVVDILAKAQGLVADGFENILTGLGTTADKMRSTIWQIGTTARSTADEFEDIYEKNWLARRVVQVFPEHALRKVPTIKDVRDQDGAWSTWSAVNNTPLNPQGVLLQGLCQGRLHGGAVILPGFRRGNPTDEAPEPGPLSEVLWLDVVRWTDLKKVQIETDANSPWYKQPIVWEIQGDHPRRGYRFHASRAVYCEGTPRARQREADETPWLSVLEPVIEELKRYDTAWQSIGLMLSEASVGVLKLQGLIGLLASKDESIVQARMQLMSQGRSAAKTVFLDADSNEDYTRTEVSFASVPQLLEQQSLQVSGATEIPVSILLGQPPAGLNATGENELRQFDDRVAVYQRTSIKPKYERLLSWVLQKPTSLEFAPIREMTDKEKAEVRASNANSDKVYVDLGVLDPPEVAQARSEDGSLGVEIDLKKKQAEWEEEKDLNEELAKTLPTNGQDPQGNELDDLEQ